MALEHPRSLAHVTLLDIDKHGKSSRPQLRFGKDSLEDGRRSVGDGGTRPPTFQRGRHSIGIVPPPTFQLRNIARHIA